MPRRPLLLALLLGTLAGWSMAATSPRVLLVGTRAGLHRIEGEPAGVGPWRREPTLAADRRAFRALARDPDTGLLLAGTAVEGGGALWASTDDGNTWRRTRHWPDSRQAWCAAFAAPGRVFAGSQPPEIFTASSPDGPWTPNASVRANPERANWSFIRAPWEAHFVTLARDPRNPAHWLAAIERGGVLRSDDDGRTWRLCSPYWDVHVVAFLPDGSLAAAAGEGLQVSHDGGAGWHAPEQPGGYATGLCVDAAGTTFAVVKGAARSPLWSSADSGRTWQPVAVEAALPHPDYGVHSLVADPDVPGRVYYGVDGAVWVVTNDRARKIADGMPAVLRLLVVR